jgi:microcystin-dependent protein
MPSTATITSTDLTEFSPNTLIKSAEVNSNVNIWRGHLLPVDPNTSAAAATGTYDLGSADYHWRNLYIDTIVGSSSWSTGDIKLTIKSVADSGWVLMNDGTIGNASSGGTSRANADTEDLFTLLWNNISDTYAPVSSGRGANAAADFAANKTITLLSALGRALGIAGSGSGLTARTLGQVLGTETHQLSESELAQHNHAISLTSGTQSANHTHTNGGGDGTFRGGGGGTQVASGSGTGIEGGSVTSNQSADHTHSIAGNSGNSGTNSAHNNMQPTLFLNIMIKL